MTFQIITFYRFQDMTLADLRLDDLRQNLRALMKWLDIKGTIILAPEGFNATVCGGPESIRAFIEHASEVLGTSIDFKSSYHDECPFKRIEVKIKPEIVTFKREIDVSLGSGTHVTPDQWNDIISDPETIVIDTRNDYEFQTGTFRRAVNPKTSRFSDLPSYVEAKLDPARHKRVATFCTGGVRCEKFAPYLKSLGFEEVYQLEGGILRYLEEMPPDQSLWHGECFVFDSRVSVDEDLHKGEAADLSIPSGPRDAAE